METVRFALRAELRARWRSLVVIALLISVVGGFVLAATAAGRRTDTAFPRFVAQYGFDATVYAARPIPQLAHLPDVVSATRVLSPSNGNPTCDCTRPINPSNFSMLGEPRGGRPIFKLISGVLADPSDPDQVLASVTLQHDDGVHVGTVIHVPFFSPSQAAASNSATNTNLKPQGPTLALHVVGIVVSPYDFASGQASSYELYTTPAFTRIVAPHTAKGFEYAVRLRGGTADLPRFDTEANRLGKAGVEGVGNLHGQIESIQGSIHPQAIGWFVLAALAALVGLTVIGQAVSRQSVVEGRDYPILTALGIGQRQLVALGMARNLILAVTGALGAIVLATALSPLAPVGEARLAELSSGISFDGIVFGTGVVAIVLAVLALGIWPAVRAALPSHKDDRAATIRHSTIVAALASLGAPPTALIGVRNALQRRTSGTTVPVGTAFLGTVLAVVALCGTAVFGSSLTHLTATPALYGDPYQLVFDVIPGLPDPALIATLTDDRNIDSITRAVTGQVLIDHETIGALAVTPLRGSIPFSTIDGHLPDANGEIGLGAATLRQVHAHVGSVIRVTVSTPSGGRLTHSFRVVSQVPLPVVGGYVGLGNGALLTMSGYQAAACPNGTRGQSGCRKAVEDSSFGALATKVVPGPRGQATITHYLNTYPLYASPPIVPTSLINFGEADNFPLIFGVIVAIFGAATIAHLLVVSVSRRRRETGLLKVLGFTNRQVLSAVAWQATTLTLLGIAIGVPLGLVAGTAIWKLFAGQIGVVPVATVSVWLIVTIVAGVIVITNLLALGPALAAMRTKPGRLMYGQQ